MPVHSFATLALACAASASAGLCPQPRIETVIVNAAAQQSNETLAPLNKPHGLAAINDTVYVLNAGALDPSLLVSQFTESTAAVGSSTTGPALVATAALPALRAAPSGLLYRLGATSGSRTSPEFAVLVNAFEYGQGTDGVAPLYYVSANDSSPQAAAAGKGCVFSDAQGLAVDAARHATWIGFAQNASGNASFAPERGGHSIIVRLMAGTGDPALAGKCDTARVPWATWRSATSAAAATWC